MAQNLTNLISEIDDDSVSRSLVCSPENIQQNISGKSFNVLHTNIRSVNCNFNHLMTLLARINTQCDVIILSECWLSKITGIPALEGYISYKSKHINQNDGVIMYVKSDIEHIIIEPTLHDANCLIMKSSTELAIVGAYRSPSSKNIENFIDSLDQILESLSSFKTVTLIGDLNINIGTNTNDSITDTYLNTLASHGLLAAHTLPTRESACLDHVMLRSNKSSTSIILDSPITDHAPTLLCSEATTYYCRRSDFMSRIDIPSVVSELSKTNFTTVFKATDANTAATELVSIITNTIAIHSKVIKIPNRKRCIKPWMTPGLLRCVKHRDNLHRKALSSPKDSVAQVIYTRYRNYCNNLLKTLKTEYDKNEISKNKGNTKGLWETIKNIVNLNKVSMPPVELLKLSDDEVKSLDQVNDFFANVGSCLASKISQDDTDSTPRVVTTNMPLSSMSLLDTDEAEVDNIIYNLRSKCATGADNIPPEVLKSARHILVPPITSLCNLCLATGVFPEIFKTALIKPIFKAGDRHSVNNYRPISILTALSKILEKILNIRLVKYLEKNNIIAKNQYGFRRTLSTENAVLELTERVVKQLDSGAKVIGIFLDLAKAFDTVSISLLVDKMERLGIRGIVLDMFRCYLTNRTQVVKIGNVSSNKATPTFGVPQGSVLGPTLFLIYINTLCLSEITNCSLITYADDTVLIAHGMNWDQARQTAENALAKVMTWLRRNLLTLNIDKTKFITFSPKSHTQPPADTFNIVAHVCNTQTNNCNCLSLIRTKDIKYLGIIIDSTLTWHNHINSLVGRIRKLLPIFKKLRSCSDSKTLTTVYTALAQSLLQYCITSWGGSDATSMLRLERAQRAVLKVMFRRPRRYPTATLYSECKLLTVRQLFILRAILTKHSSLSPNQMSQGRRAGFCDVYPHRTALARRQFYIAGSRLYNKVNKTKHIYLLTSSRCKNLIKSWLLTCNYRHTEDLLK